MISFAKAEERGIFMKVQATIRDVAQQANVSISTVSRVMNDLDRVSDEVRNRVKKVAKRLNYVPNNIAVSMVKGQTRTVLVVVPDIINEYYTSVIHGVEEVAQSKGYTTIVYASNSEEEKEAGLFSGGPLAKMIDGAIVVPASSDFMVYRQFGKPLVLVDRYIVGSGLPGVVIDNFGGSYQLMKLLVENGHRKIAAIMGDMTFNIGQERYLGYEQALKENGIKINNEYVYYGDWYRNTGYDGMRKLLSLPEPPTAVYATNNLLCIGCIEALKDAGMTVGKDISLVGFDDHILAEFVDDGVTVVTRPMVDMGIVAAEKLFRAFQGKNIEEKIVLDIAIKKRGSIRRI